MTGGELLVLGIDPGSPGKAALAACLVGAAGDHEGSILLPSVWHPEWEAEWNDFRREVAQLRRIPLQETLNGR